MHAYTQTRFLTERERLVLALVAEGKTNGAIAKDLHLSSSTIKAHVSSILIKLECTDRTQAAVRAVKLGWV